MLLAASRRLAVIQRETGDEKTVVTLPCKMFRRSEESATRRMRGRKKKEQRKDSNAEARYQRDVPNQKTRVHGR